MPACEFRRLLFVSEPRRSNVGCLTRDLIGALAPIEHLHTLREPARASAPQDGRYARAALRGLHPGGSALKSVALELSGRGEDGVQHPTSSPVSEPGKRGHRSVNVKLRVADNSTMSSSARGGSPLTVIPRSRKTAPTAGWIRSANARSHAASFDGRLTTALQLDALRDLPKIPP